jgi:hypothetical protein
MSNYRALIALVMEHPTYPFPVFRMLSLSIPMFLEISHHSFSLSLDFAAKCPFFLWLTFDIFW